MGMFMASVSFRCTDKEKWEMIKPEILNMLQGMDGLVNNLNSDGPGYAILSPYGDKGQFLAELPEIISMWTGDYAVMAMCVDSDFNTLELFHAGVLLEQSVIGEIYEEYSEFMEVTLPDISHWKPLLQDPSWEDALSEALLGEEILAEDSLRKLSKLTGLPIFDDALMMAGME